MRCRHEAGSVIGVSYTTYDPSPITRWYAARLPGHVHQWMHTGNYSGNFLMRSQRGVGGSFWTTNPMWTINENEQLAFLEAASPTTLYRFTDLLAHHRQKEAVDLILGSQTPAQAFKTRTIRTGLRPGCA